jgi:FAD/FMN-containing dehydrogenase
MSERGERVTGFDLAALDRMLQHTPEDMTATVEAGLTLERFQERLAEHGQWLPIDPPQPNRLTIGALLAVNKSGPRRFGYGTIRESLLGLKVALADGRLINAGGKVVKNVAGYDLCKLFVGSRGTLGVIVEATFKLRPLPEAEQFIQATCDSLERAGALIEAVLASELTPVVLDLHRGLTLHAPRSTLHVLLGFVGTREEVDWQLAKARELGLNMPATLQHEQAFWSTDTTAAVHSVSVLPSKLIDTLGSLDDAPFVARAGNGIVYYRGGPAPKKNEMPLELTRRLKQAFDPKAILPELPL